MTRIIGILDTACLDINVLLNVFNSFGVSFLLVDVD